MSNRLTNFKDKFLQTIKGNITFEDEASDFQVRHSVINISIALAVAGLTFNTVLNIVHINAAGIILDLTSIVVLLVMGYLLRTKHQWFEAITSLLSLEFIIIFDLLIMISRPEDLRHIWLLTFPALIFFYKDSNTGIRWIFIFILSLFLTKLQPFFKTNYTLGDISYISIVILTMTFIIYFYKARIDQGNEIITRQKEELEVLTKSLEHNVKEKTKELQELNSILEDRIQSKVRELVEKDALILAQSRQAAMGEMISMIAHQWRQPLSTITLQIATIKINALLGKASVEETNNALEHISSTIIYLSETIDDFQSFFKPNKQLKLHTVCELIERGINFTRPRLVVANIELSYTCNKHVNIMTYANEFAQVIINIVNNAIDAHLDAQTVDPQIYVEIQTEKSSIKIIIKDNAGGIEEKNINQIFEPYYSTKGKNGTGLGLYMSKIIIEKELGGLLYANNVHEGAAFTIELPLQQ